MGWEWWPPDRRQRWVTAWPIFERVLQDRFICNQGRIDGTLSRQSRVFVSGDGRPTDIACSQPIEVGYDTELWKMRFESRMSRAINIVTPTRVMLQKIFLARKKLR